MKKYEVYENGKRYGILNWDNKLMRKILAVSVSAVISVTSLSGCRINKKPNAVSYPQTIETNKFNSLDEEIELKLNFIDNVLEEIIKADNQIIYNKIMNNYRRYAALADSISSDNEYSIFLTEEEINSKKRQMLNELNEMIRLVETLTNYKFNEDFQKFSYGSK